MHTATKQNGSWFPSLTVLAAANGAAAKVVAPSLTQMVEVEVDAVLTPAVAARKVIPTL